MSEVSVKYSELKSASGEAKTVSKKLDAYANSINNTVIKKLNKYSGDHTSNFSSALRSAQSKKSQLEEKKQKFENYSTALSDLNQDCKDTDSAVAQKVKSLTGTFKTAYGIKDSWIENSFGLLLTKISNSNPIFRWIDNNIIEPYKIGKEALKDGIKLWYNYGGGKEFIKGATGALLDIGIAIAGIVVAVAAFIAAPVITAFGVVVLVAALVGGAIAIINGVVNLANEISGQLNYNKEGGASFAYRRSKLDTLSNTLRTDSDSESVHVVASVIDTVKFACDVIGLLDSLSTITKKVYKWATGDLADISALKVKDILTKDNFKKVLNKIKTDNIFTAVNKNGLCKTIQSISSDFVKTLKGRYSMNSKYLSEWKKVAVPTGTLDIYNWAKTGKVASSIKNILTLSKNIMEEGLFKTAVNEIINSINIIDSKTNILDSSGNPITTKPDKVSIGDLKKAGEKLIKYVPETFDYIDKLKEKLSSLSNINISVPEIYVPEIEINININFRSISKNSSSIYAAA